LLSSSSGGFVILVVFLIGALLFAIGTVLARRERPRREEPVDESLVIAQPGSVADRLEMIERLVMVGQPWCVDELRALLERERDPLVRDAAEAALMVIGSRGPAG